MKLRDTAALRAGQVQGELSISVAEVKYAVRSRVGFQICNMRWYVESHGTGRDPYVDQTS